MGVTSNESGIIKKSKEIMYEWSRPTAGGRPTTPAEEEAGLPQNTFNAFNTNFQHYQQLMEQQEKSMLYGSAYAGGTVVLGTDPYKDHEKIRLSQQFNFRDMRGQGILIDNIVHIAAPGTYKLRARFAYSINDFIDENKGVFDIELEPLELEPPEVKHQEVLESLLKESEKRVEELEAILAIKEMTL